MGIWSNEVIVEVEGAKEAITPLKVVSVKLWALQNGRKVTRARVKMTEKIAGRPAAKVDLVLDVTFNRAIQSGDVGKKVRGKIWVTAPDGSKFTIEIDHAIGRDAVGSSAISFAITHHAFAEGVWVHKAELEEEVA